MIGMLKKMGHVVLEIWLTYYIYSISTLHIFCSESRLWHITCSTHLTIKLVQPGWNSIWHYRSTASHISWLGREQKSTGVEVWASRKGIWKRHLVGFHPFSDKTLWLKMSQLRCRSSSSDKNEDSVRRDQRSSSIADEDNPKVKVTTISRSRSNSPAPSKSKSKSKSRSRNRNRCRSKNNSSGRERSRSNSRRARGHKRPRSGGRSRLSRSRSRSPKRNGKDDGYRLHIAG